MSILLPLSLIPGIITTFHIQQNASDMLIAKGIVPAILALRNFNNLGNFQRFQIQLSSHANSFLISVSILGKDI
jgi:hypothetical protein